MNAMITKSLIGLNIAVFLLQNMAGEPFVVRFALWPLQAIDGEHLFRIWQIITHAFMHGGATHLLVNMFGLWMFGRDVEMVQGPRRFAQLYFASVMTAALAQLFLPPWFGANPGPTVGASGGVFGVLLAFAVYFPNRRVVPLIPPIPMPAWVFACGYAAIELYSGVTGTQAGVAHFAHLGGMVGAGAMLFGARASRR
jgi:membrane associated rhomboid family serine protease